MLFHTVMQGYEICFEFQHIFSIFPKNVESLMRKILKHIHHDNEFIL